MYWRTDRDRCDEWVLLAHGVAVARIARDASHFVVRVKFADIDLLGVYCRSVDAQRFAERELWSAAGEALRMHRPGGAVHAVLPWASAHSRRAHARGRCP